MATRGSGAGVIPSGTSEPWKWAENEARTNNALYEMFVRQAFDAEQKELAREDARNNQGIQNEFTLGRDALSRDFTRERDATQQDFTMEREGLRGAARVNADTQKTFSKVVKDLAKEFEIPEYIARGMAAEAAYESGGFRVMQEGAPVVPGSRGGYGYNQWTGPRRVAFERFAQQQGLSPDSYDANIGFWKTELRSPENKAYMARLAKAKDAYEAAQITRNMFLRPLSVQRGVVDVGRNNSVRRYLNLPLEEQINNAQQAATAPANTQQTVQQPAGQPQPATVQQAGMAAPVVPTVQSKALGGSRYVLDPKNPSRSILVTQ